MEVASEKNTPEATIPNIPQQSTSALVPNTLTPPQSSAPTEYMEENCRFSKAADLSAPDSLTPNAEITNLSTSSKTAINSLNEYESHSFETSPHTAPGAFADSSIDTAVVKKKASSASSGAATVPRSYCESNSDAEEEKSLEEDQNGDDAGSCTGVRDVGGSREGEQGQSEAVVLQHNQGDESSQLDRNVPCRICQSKLTRLVFR